MADIFDPHTGHLRTFRPEDNRSGYVPAPDAVITSLDALGLVRLIKSTVEPAVDAASIWFRPAADPKVDPGTVYVVDGGVWAAMTPAKFANAIHALALSTGAPSSTLSFTSDIATVIAHLDAASSSFPVATPTKAGSMSGADKAKLDGLTPDGEANVQADWNEGNSLLDPFIKNKPALGQTTASDDLTLSLGTDSVIIRNATAALAGLLSSTDKAKLDQLTVNFKGVYADLAALTLAIPMSVAGDWAILANPMGSPEFAAWDTVSADWIVASAVLPNTNLSNTPAASSVDIESSTGSNTTVPAATPSLAGVMSAADKAALDAFVAGGVPSGMIFPFAANSAPAGSLKCNGAAIGRVAYAALFAAIGTTWGVGDGSTTFNVPDLRGDFIRGWDDGRGIDTGRVFSSLQTDELRAHTHTTSIPYGAPGSTAARIGLVDTLIASIVYTSSSTGGAETRPRNSACLFCIKY